MVQNNFILTSWLSGNEKIVNFIQEIQLKIESHYDIVFEWIPYNQFYNIKETGKNGFMTVYSAIWKDGPLYYDKKHYCKYMRDLNKKVALKCLHNLQNPVVPLIDEVMILKYYIYFDVF
jgi:hypothetical protein